MSESLIFENLLYLSFWFLSYDFEDKGEKYKVACVTSLVDHIGNPWKGSNRKHCARETLVSQLQSRDVTPFYDVFEGFYVD